MLHVIREFMLFLSMATVGYLSAVAFFWILNSKELSGQPEALNRVR